MATRGTILVVDDNPMVREVVQGMLNSLGFRALAAEDGSTALAIFAGEQINAAIIDVDMPDMNGVDVCRALQAQAAAMRQPLRAWMMTGVIRPELVDSALAAGATGVLGKPFTKAELIACFDALEATADAQRLAS